METLHQKPAHFRDLHYHPLVISPELQSTLERPLIIGASVSANHRGVASPALQLALHATTPDLIKTIARNGTPASLLLKLVKNTDLVDRTCVIGLDLLFWDSTRNDVEESIHEFHQFTEQVAALELPIALGDIPGFFPTLQPNWKRLNHEIEYFKQAYSKCVVLPFDALYHQTIQEGALDYHGVQYSLHELVPDGLHLSSLAGRVLADRLQEEWLKNLHAQKLLSF